MYLLNYANVKAYLHNYENWPKYLLTVQTSFVYFLRKIILGFYNN